MSDARRATTADIGLVGGVAAAAFEADPVMAWVFPDPATRLDFLTLAMTGHAGSFLPDHSAIWMVDDASVALWRSPDYDHHAEEAVPPEDGEPDDGGLPAEVVERFATMHTAMQAQHPREPHWYLNVLGTNPAHQSRGLGSRTVAPVLATCDTEGVPAYLESSNPRNIPFYFRLGFVQTGEITLPDGPSLYPMWRTPRS